MTGVQTCALPISAIDKYFNPVRNELTSNTLTSIELIKEQKALNVDFKIEAFTLSEFRKFLDINLEKLVEELTYQTSLPA